jgi:ubiquinone/menaquinone biosynthesis C-methylase UbiE
LLAGPVVATDGKAAEPERQSAAEYEQQIEREFREIAVLLDLSTPGKVVADVGAGVGVWSVRLAKVIAPTGRVIATEIVADRARATETRAKRLALSNLTSVVSTQTDTGLSANCCDAVLLRRVYHDFADPIPMRRGLAQAVKPNGLLLVIDFWPSIADLVQELGSVGFRAEHRIDVWQNDARIYAVLFRRAT